MIEMQMGQNDMADLRLRAQRKASCDSAGIDQKGVIYQESTGLAGSRSTIALEQPIRTVTTQYVNFHAVSSRL